MSTLFVALCREAGIKANLVLLNTRDNSKVSQLLPSVSFNHCIARLEIDNKIYYLELTHNKLPFGAALSNDLQSPVLTIPYKNEKQSSEILFMDMPFRPKNEIVRTTKITITGKDMQIEVRSDRTGQLAANMRYDYADLSSEDRLKGLNERIASDWKTPAKATNLTFINLDNLADTMTTIYNIEAKNALQEVSSMKLLKLPWSDAVTSLALVASETRKYPLEFWYYMYRDHEIEEITLSLGGLQFIEMPKNIKLDCPAASYELIFERKGNDTMIAKRIFRTKQDIISPDEYEQFKTFFNAVVENDAKQYALK